MEPENLENQEEQTEKSNLKPASMMMLGMGNWVASCSLCGEKHAEASSRKELPKEVECECKTMVKAE